MVKRAKKTVTAGKPERIILPVGVPGIEIAITAQERVNHALGLRAWAAGCSITGGGLARDVPVDFRAGQLFRSLEEAVANRATEILLYLERPLALRELEEKQLFQVRKALRKFRQRFERRGKAPPPGTPVRTAAAAGNGSHAKSPSRKAAKSGRKLRPTAEKAGGGSKRQTEIAGEGPRGDCPENCATCRQSTGCPASGAYPPDYVAAGGDAGVLRGAQAVSARHSPPATRRPPTAAVPSNPQSPIPNPSPPAGELVEPLTRDERRELARLERVIEKGRDTFLEVGRALAKIQAERLYRGEGTFEDYCRAHGFSRSDAYRQIRCANFNDAAGKVIEKSQLVITESHVRGRDFQKLDPADAPEVATIIAKRIMPGPDGKRRPTAELVAEIVHEYVTPAEELPQRKSSDPANSAGQGRAGQGGPAEGERCQASGVREEAEPLPRLPLEKRAPRAAEVGDAGYWNGQPAAYAPDLHHIARHIRMTATRYPAGANFLPTFHADLAALLRSLADLISPLP
jgi:hypothetical protein